MVLILKQINSFCLGIKKLMKTVINFKNLNIIFVLLNEPIHIYLLSKQIMHLDPLASSSMNVQSPYQ